MPNRSFVSGTRGIPAADAAESRIIPFILSTQTRDRHHTVLNQANWNLDNYRKNPVVQYMHSTGESLINPPNPDFLIGKSVFIGTEGNGKDKMLVARVQFEAGNLNPLAEKVFRKVMFGSLRASSVSFIEVGTGNWGKGEEAQGRSQESYYFAGQELLEWSLVNVPSNPDSVKRGNRFVREQPRSAVLYALRELGCKYSVSQIEDMRIFQILDLLDGKDLGIRETDPTKVRKMINDEMTRKDVADMIEKQQVEFKKRILKDLDIGN